MRHALTLSYGVYLTYVRDAWVQELRDKGQVDMVAIPRKENKSDILTHCLSSGNFNKEVGYIQNQANSD